MKSLRRGFWRYVVRTRAAQMNGIKRRNTILGRLAVAILLQMAAGTLALRDVAASIPKVVASGGAATLVCRWSLDPGETLYSVKWYRSRQEFYRYLPKELPHTRVFSHDGINVDLSRSGEHQVVLESLTRNLTGHYRCEISADAPSFHTDTSSSYMHVVDLPHSGPVITSEKAWYSAGDLLRANCSSPPADPPASITWMVNGRLVSGLTHMNTTSYIYDPRDISPAFQIQARHSTASQIQVQSSQSTRSPSVRTLWMRRPSISSLELHITPEYFDTGRIKLTCVANVHTIYSAQAELELQEEKPQIASVLHTRDGSINSGNVGVKSILVTVLLCFTLIYR